MTYTVDFVLHGHFYVDDIEAESKEDFEILQDAIVAACKQLYEAIDDETEEKMSKYSALLGGFGGFGGF